MRLYSQVNYRNVPKIDNDEIAFNFKTIRNSPSGIPGNWDSLNSRSGIPGNFKIFWFVKKYLDVDVDVVDLRAQADASMPASNNNVKLYNISNF